MKKILFGIFAVIMSITSSYCDGPGYISMGSSTSDVMNSVISAGAIIQAFADDHNGGCGFLSSKDKDEISKLVYGSMFYPEVKDLTVKDVYDVLYFYLVDSRSSGHANNQTDAQRCIMAIIEKHNWIVQNEEKIKQERQSAEWKKGKIFTSEQEYNETVQTKGKCAQGNSNIIYNDNSAPKTLNKCKKYCRDFATANACFLETVLFSRKDHVECHCQEYNRTDGMQGFMNQNPYYFIPTWEDYKKLYNMD